MAAPSRGAGGLVADQSQRPQADEPGDGEQGGQVAQHSAGIEEVGGEGQEDEHIGQGDPGQSPLHGGGGGVALVVLVLILGAVGFVVSHMASLIGWFISAPSRDRGSP